MRRRRNLFLRQRLPASKLTPKRKFPLKFLLAAGVLLIPLLVLFALFNSPFLRIKEFDCSLDNHACREAHLSFLNQYRGKNVLFLKPNLISQKLLEEDLSLLDSEVNLIFPHKLKVTLISNSKVITLGLLKAQETPIDLSPSPNATISTDSSILRSHPLITQFNLIKFENPTLFGLTSSGHLVTSQETSTRLFSLEDPNSLSEIDLISLFQYEQELEKSALIYDRSLFLNPNLLMFFKNDTYVIFDIKKPSRTAVATLQQIRATDTINFDRAIIDLRFNKPVISNY